MPSQDLYLVGRGPESRTCYEALMSLRQPNLEALDSRDAVLTNAEIEKGRKILTCMV